MNNFVNHCWSECKNSAVGKFAQDFSLTDDGEGSTTNISANEVFTDLMNKENIKQEHISTNPFLDNYVNKPFFSNNALSKYLLEINKS